MVTFSVFQSIFFFLSFLFSSRIPVIVYGDDCIYSIYYSKCYRFYKPVKSCQNWYANVFFPLLVIK